MGDEMKKQEGEQVELTIRCALQSFDDTTISCALDSTVLELKALIHATCASRPEVARQRLIYAGQCLHNERTLRSLLHRDGAITQVIHLVCPPKDLNAFDLRRRKTSRATNNVAASNSPSINANPTNEYWTNFLANTPASSTPNAQAYHLMYQTYMANYLNYMQMMGVAGNPYGTFATPPAVVPPIGAAQNVAEPALAPAAVAAPAGNNEQVLNVQVLDHLPLPDPFQGGVAGDEGELGGARDFLDYAYTFIRFCFLAMVVYVYSSAERFIAVLFFVVGIWFLQMRRNRQQLVNNNNHNNQGNLNPPPNNNNPRVRNDDEEEWTDDSSDETTPPRHRDVPRIVPERTDPTAWYIFWSTCYTFITSFFSSLLPENQIPVNLN